MNLKDFKKHLNSIPDEYNGYTIVKSQGVTKCKVDKLIKVIYI